jgi:hypothetical protein
MMQQTDFALQPLHTHALHPRGHTAPDVSWLCPTTDAQSILLQALNRLVNGAALGCQSMAAQKAKKDMLKQREGAGQIESGRRKKGSRNVYYT